MDKKFYVTTAIAYTSSKPHIGNVYEAILTDAIARFKRKQGYDVFFQTGTDEHGQKIEEKAKAAGKTPKEYVDGVSAVIKSIWDLMNISYDKFIRTTDEYHEKQVAKIFRKFYEQGDIYKGFYEGKYCTPCETFYTESQLVGGKCPTCGGEVRSAKEEAYFFKMSKYAPKLIDYINSHPEFIQPVARKNEMMNNFLNAGLQDLCVSRTSFKWGIPVDFDDKHVVYVWLDALTNYITGIGYDADGNSSAQYKKFWPADLHVIGKDIIRFHTIYWPIFLMALGEPLPKTVFGHAWILQNGWKMSKSKGNVMYADDLVELFGVDAVRYYSLVCMPYDSDGNLTLEMMTEKINADLANVYGNLVKRTIAMSQKYFGGTVENAGVNEEIDEDLKNQVVSAYKNFARDMDEYRIADAIEGLISVLRRANKYIDETAPWILAKDEANVGRLKTVLYNLTETIVVITSLLEPIIPSTAERVLKQLNSPDRAYSDMDKFGLYKSGTKVTDNAEIIFNRLNIEEIYKKAAEIENRNEPKPAEEEKMEMLPEITIDDFAKIQLKVATVVACEKIEKSKKLLKLSLKVGDEDRTVASGIAEYYKPEELVGKNVVIVYNLKPARLCGVESQGMILCAEKDGKVIESERPCGATVR